MVRFETNRGHIAIKDTGNVSERVVKAMRAIVTVGKRKKLVERLHFAYSQLLPLTEGAFPEHMRKNFRETMKELEAGLRGEEPMKIPKAKQEKLALKILLLFTETVLLDGSAKYLVGVPFPD